MRNPLTGEGCEIPVKDGAIELNLPIGHSVLITVRAIPASHSAIPSVDAPALALQLDGLWTRTPLAGGPEYPSVVTGTLPLPWGITDTFPETAFCGTMRYEKTFSINEVNHDFMLNLGRVEQSAKVFVNGCLIGGAIMAPYCIRIPRNVLKKGENHLAVDVTSTGANRLRWLDATKPYEWKIFTDINMVDIDYQKFDASGWPPREYGLFGPVLLHHHPYCPLPEP